MELHIFHKDASVFDQVKSAKAEFDENKGILFSEGDVEITMGVPADSNRPPAGADQIVRRHLREQDREGFHRPARQFRVRPRQGNAVGASYDPQIARTADEQPGASDLARARRRAKPMQVEAGEATYKEKESKVYLGGWSKLMRDTMTLNAGPAVVTIEEGTIQQVNYRTCHGQRSAARPEA